MPKIKDLKAREIIDSRGNPTIETTVFLDNGLFARASVPSGASKGTHEAVELRDRDLKRFHGLGVLKAIDIIESKIKPVIVNSEISNQEEIDRKMIEADGTIDKSHFGANSILSVSLSCARVSALNQKMPIYKLISQLISCKIGSPPVTPMFNIVNGGLHGGNKKLTIQEFLLIPQKQKSFAQNLQIGVEIYLQLKKIIKKQNFSTAVGDEGGFSPEFTSNDMAIGMLSEAIKQSGYQYTSDVSIGLDMASSSYYQDGRYTDLYNPNNTVDTNNYYSQVIRLIDEYNLVSLEDPFEEDDWENWIKLTKEIGKKTMIIGDDLLVTNKDRLKQAIEQKACNSILVKVNQIGTLTETLEVIKHAKKAAFKVIISHRSGETNDDFIADLAVGVCADFVKFGAPARGERIAKYNRLLQIYQEIK